jgi:hypothetical protein
MGIFGINLLKLLTWVEIHVTAGTIDIPHGQASHLSTKQPLSETIFK